jgi:CHASE3 domain sensor protein
MEESDQLKLLAEIRDAQREHLAEYRKVAQESLALQKQAVARQEQIAKLYRRVLVAGGVLILLLLIVFVYYLFSFLR